MPKKMKPLTEIKVRTDKPKEKAYKLFDGYGLYLLITSPGGKLWRFKYHFKEKEKMLTLGAYPSSLFLLTETLRCVY